MESWDVWKRRKFPWVKDWTANQDHIKDIKDVGTIDWHTWFWFHPSAYAFINYGMNVQGMIIMSIFGMILLRKALYFPAGLLIILDILFLINLINKYKSRWQRQGLTFYDMHLREYKPPENGL